MTSRKRNEPGEAIRAFTPKREQRKSARVDAPPATPEAPHIDLTGEAVEQRLMKNAEWLEGLARALKGIPSISTLNSSRYFFRAPRPHEYLIVDNIFGRGLVKNIDATRLRVIDSDYDGVLGDYPERSYAVITLPNNPTYELGRYLLNGYEEKHSLNPDEVAGLDYAVFIAKALEGFTPQSLKVAGEFRDMFEKNDIETVLFPGTVLTFGSDTKGILGIEMKKVSGGTVHNLIFQPLNSQIRKKTGVLYF